MKKERDEGDRNHQRPQRGGVSSQSKYGDKRALSPSRRPQYEEQTHSSPRQHKGGVYRCPNLGSSTCQCSDCKDYRFFTSHRDDIQLMRKAIDTGEWQRFKECRIHRQNDSSLRWNGDPWLPLRRPVNVQRRREADAELRRRYGEVTNESITTTPISTPRSDSREHSRERGPKRYYEREKNEAPASKTTHERGIDHYHSQQDREPYGDGAPAREVSKTRERVGPYPTEPIASEDSDYYRKRDTDRARPRSRDAIDDIDPTPPHGLSRHDSDSYYESDRQRNMTPRQGPEYSNRREATHDEVEPVPQRRRSQPLFRRGARRQGGRMRPCDRSDGNKSPQEDVRTYESNVSHDHPVSLPWHRDGAPGGRPSMGSRMQRGPPLSRGTFRARPRGNDRITSRETSRTSSLTRETRSRGNSRDFTPDTHISEERSLRHEDDRASRDDPSASIRATCESNRPSSHGGRGRADEFKSDAWASQAPFNPRRNSNRGDVPPLIDERWNRASVSTEGRNDGWEDGRTRETQVTEPLDRRPRETNHAYPMRGGINRDPHPTLTGRNPGNRYDGGSIPDDTRGLSATERKMSNSGGNQRYGNNEASREGARSNEPSPEYSRSRGNRYGWTSQQEGTSRGGSRGRNEFPQTRGTHVPPRADTRFFDNGESQNRRYGDTRYGPNQRYPSRSFNSRRGGSNGAYYRPVADSAGTRGGNDSPIDPWVTQDGWGKSVAEEKRSEETHEKPSSAGKGSQDLDTEATTTKAEPNASQGERDDPRTTEEGEAGALESYPPPGFSVNERGEPPIITT